MVVLIGIGRLWLRTTVAAGATLLALAVVEVSLRLLDVPPQHLDFQFLGPEFGAREVFQPDEVLFWRLRSDAVEFEANVLGLRGWLPRGEKAQNDVRILCVGDSSTFGVHCKLQDSWPRRLERAVQQGFPMLRVEVVVAALPGWSTFQNLKAIEAHLPRFAPDLAVLYVGAWNDYVPAVGDPDHVRAGRGWLARTRIAKVVQRFSVPDRDIYVAEFEAGIARHGRRVPIEEFRANLEQMATQLEAAGATICMVVPPVHDDTLARFPIAHRYHDMLKTVAATRGIETVDARRTFVDEDARVPAVQPIAGRVLTACYADGVHPTPHGHALLASVLEPVAARVAAGVAARAVPRPAPDLHLIHEARVDSLAGATLSVAGPDSGAVERVQIGQTTVATRPSGTELVTFDVPSMFPPGSHALTALGGFGSHPLGAVNVDGPEIHARLETAEAGTALVFEGAGPPGWNILVWVAKGLAPGPATTDYGEFLLVGHGAQPMPGGDARLPLHHVQLPGFSGQVDRTGRFVVRHPLEQKEVAHLARGWFAQGLLLDEADAKKGVLTATARGMSGR